MKLKSNFLKKKASKLGMRGGKRTLRFGRTSLKQICLHPAATPGCLLLCCAEAARYASRIGCGCDWVLDSRLCRSFRMTVCSAAILRGAALLVRGGPADACGR